jgi:hypothetical protein
LKKEKKMSSASDVEMKETLSGEEEEREQNGEERKTTTTTTTRVDDDVEMTTVEETIVPPTTTKTKTARQNFVAFVESNKSTWQNWLAKQTKYQETAKYYEKSLRHLEGLMRTATAISPTEYVSKSVPFLQKALPLLVRAEKEERDAKKAENDEKARVSEEEMEDIVNISDDDEDMRKEKEANAWKNVGYYADGVLDESVYKDEQREKKSPNRTNAKSTDHDRRAERIWKSHEKNSNNVWKQGNGGVSQTKSYTRKKNPTNIGSVTGRGASLAEIARFGDAVNTRSTTTPRSAPPTLTRRQSVFCPEKFNFGSEKRPKTRSDLSSSAHKSRERMFEASLNDLDEDDPIEDVRPIGRRREAKEKREPIVVDLVDSEDDESNKPIEIDSPVQQTRRTTRQNAGSLGSSVARFGKYTAEYPNDGSKGAAVITTKDLDCLEPGEMLNDQTIDFYMKKISEEEFSSPEDKERCLVMNSYFYQKLTQKSNGTSNMAERKDQAYERVKNWTKSINIFEKDFILIPIHGLMHWSLAIISYPGLAVREGRNLSCIIHLDSLGSGSAHTHSTISKNLTQWLQREYNRVESERTGNVVEDGAALINGKTMLSLNPSVPLQTNGCDCGVFTLLYAQKFIQNLPKELTKADSDSLIYGKMNHLRNQNRLLFQPYCVLTPRMPKMDKYIETCWKEEILKRRGSPEKEEVKEKEAVEEENISLHIVGEKEEEEEEINDLRDEDDDDDVKHFKSKVQPSTGEEGGKNSENKENDLKSSEEVAIISETDGKSSCQEKVQEEEKEEERYMSIEKILQAFPKTWIQTNCPEMFRETWFPAMESAEQMRVCISVVILEALGEEVMSKSRELEAKQNALPESEKENDENAVVKNFKNVTQLVSIFADTTAEKRASLSDLDRKLAEAKLKMSRLEKKRMNDRIQMIFEAREKEDEKIEKVKEAAERKRMTKSSDDDDDVCITGYKSKPNERVQTTLQHSDREKMFARGRTIWKDGIQPPRGREEQATMRKPPSPPPTRLNDQDDMARKMRRSNNAGNESMNQEIRDARLKHSLANPSRERTPPEKKEVSVLDRFPKRRKS